MVCKGFDFLSVKLKPVTFYFFNMKYSFFYLALFFSVLQGCNDSENHNLRASMNSKEDESSDKVIQGGDFTEAAKTATPAVVHIATYARQMPRDPGPFEKLLREYRERRGESTQQQSQSPYEGLILAGLGSAVIVRPEGYLVTSLHILQYAEKIEVSLHDRRVYTAEIVGMDPETDLAILKIDDTNLPTLEFDDSDKLQVGDWIAAVGNPFNLTSTVTAGIVSAKSRSINLPTNNNGRSIQAYIQTDAAVNPGNSGGALINMRGELVGIYAAIASPTGAFAGYSFAIPANLVRKTLEDILEYGEVRRGLLGVNIVDVNSQLAAQYDLESLQGVYVANVAPNGAAAEAGIQTGDVILGIEGNDVQTTGDLQEIVGMRRPGEEISITFRRNGQTREAEASLGD